MVQACKKRKSKISLVLNAHFEIEDNKVSTADTSDIGNESGTWFRNKCANESGLNIGKREYDNENESDLEVEESRAVSPKVPRKKIKSN